MWSLHAWRCATASSMRRPGAAALAPPEDRPHTWGMKNQATFDIHCTLCPRLMSFLGETRKKHPDYHALPVPPFGDAKAGLVIVGLAPGMHGANRTGRPFTGDFAGILLYQTLYKFGLSNSPVSVSAGDDLELVRARITNSVKCLPPQNKP